MKRLILVCAAFLCLSGCARQTQVEIKNDPFLPVTEVSGIPEYQNPLTFTTVSVTRVWRLRSWVSKTSGHVKHQIFAKIFYTGAPLKRFMTAFDEDAQTLKVIPLAREGVHCETSCTVIEDIGMDIDEQTLKRKAAAGYKVEVRAQAGDIIILTLTPAMIQSQLDAVDRLLEQQHKGAN